MIKSKSKEEHKLKIVSNKKYNDLETSLYIRIYQRPVSRPFVIRPNPQIRQQDIFLTQNMLEYDQSIILLVKSG